MRDQYDLLVEQLAVPHRRRAAHWRLYAAGAAAAAAVRRGLHHDSADVRRNCCMILDHYLDEAAIPDLIENIEDPDPMVRAWAVHALACDRCKEGECRPGENASLPLAIRMLRDDPAKEVRQQAAGLVGPAVHRSAAAREALIAASEHDPHPVVRKIAGWWVPGGPRYERTKPRPVRRSH